MLFAYTTPKVALLKVLGELNDKTTSVFVENKKILDLISLQLYFTHLLVKVYIVWIKSRS